MDGSITIGIELKDQKFSETLSRLRHSAEQTALQGFQTLVNSLNSIASAFAHTASAGTGWSQQMRGVFNHVSAGAASLAPLLLNAGRSAGYQFMNGILSVDSTGAGRSLAQKALAGFSVGGYYAAGASAASQIARGLSYGGQSILYYARSIAYGVGSAFYGGWYSVGYNIAAGIASGIYGGSSLIRYAAVSAAQDALYWARRALGIYSPSRVFRVVEPKSSVKRKYPSPDRSLLISAIFREWPEKLARSFRSGFPATAVPSARKPMAER